MSSTNKTEYLGLNSWASTDVPKRTDFNYDNSVIDEAMKNHNDNSDVHLRNGERDIWNSPYYMGVYYGTGGSAERTIATGCPFQPRFGIIFANGTAPAVTNFSGSANSNYFALVSSRANTIGASVSGNNLLVKSSAAPSVSNEYPNLNASGYTYCYILFR